MICDDPAVWRRLISTPFKSYFFRNFRAWQLAGRTDLQGSLDLAKINSAGMTDSRAAEAVLATLGPIRADLDELVTAACNRPQSRLELDYAHVLDGRSWPRYATMDVLSGALTLRASAELRLGDNTAAFGDALALIRLALVSASSSPAFPAQGLKNKLLHNNVLQIFWEGWAINAWTEANYAGFQSWFNQADGVPVLPLTIRMEQESLLNEGSRPFSFMAFTCKGPRGWILQDFAHVIRMTELVQAGVDAPIRRFNPEKLRQFSAAIDTTRNSFQYWEQILAYTAYTQTYVDFARVVCALERHRFSHGDYPATLAELAPGLIERLPRDLISGDLLHYVKSASAAAKVGFKLYAIGWNGHDDHGEPSPVQRRGNSYSVDIKSGDWVWPQLTRGTEPEKSAVPVKTSGASP
jgi:hypothetical protein